MKILTSSLIVIAALFGVAIIYILGSMAFPMVVTRFPVFKDCEDYYYNFLTKQVYFSQSGNWFAQSFQALPGVKNNGQLKLIGRINLSRGLGDGGRFFIGAEEKSEIDASMDITLIGFSYMKNNGKVYFIDRTELYPLAEADFDSFQSDNNNARYARDRKSVFWEKYIFPGANPESFVNGDSNMVSHDGVHIFFIIKGRDDVVKIEKVALKSSRIQGEGDVYHDGHQIFYINHKTSEVIVKPLINPASLKVTYDEIVYDSTKVLKKDLEAD